MIVGVVIFVIITIVQFLVITKGSERIAEVSARFALDAMPGKQMVIDGDFNAGLISPEEAVIRRENLQRESALFGSMDGAMKFVKGDTIAGIIIVIINIIGGLSIGMLMNGMSPEEAMQKYTILTIGDGLSQQLPSLLMAISSGIVMTRTTSSSSSLAKDLANQVMSKPSSLFLASGFLALIRYVLGQDCLGFHFLFLVFCWSRMADLWFLLIRMFNRKWDNSNMLRQIWQNLLIQTECMNV